MAASMQPIIDAIGFDAALSLAACFGGTRVVLPQHPSARDVICRAISAEQAAALERAIGSGPLEIPRCVSWLLASRNEQIIARHLAGESQAELALRFSITERHIRNIMATDQPTLGATPPQPDLFTSRSDT